ncbi:MAG TPA: tryptophan synthase subunit alpha [Vicinamibacterales bacterium]|nr:tryptophan synthase subunit alpha [Vicinamibacterales bacterium]
MMTRTDRIAGAFARLRRAGRGGLVTYITAGDPDLETSADVLVALAGAGADVLEVGVPFSDPVADGPVIQRATERALAAGATLRGVLDVIRTVRGKVETPIVLFTYANPVVRMEPGAFAHEAAAAGVDGVLVLDYPVEEAEPLRRPLVAAGLDPIFLISPTTSDARIRASSQLGAGFLYVISRLGVTGARDEMAPDVEELMRRVRRNTSLPVALGFGISRPEHVAAACRYADAAVVGSALVTVIAERGRRGAAAGAGEFVRWLKSAL